jgi:hypothetical protein
VLDEALEAAGIDRAETYVTNVVKHFKWKPSGKKRLHDKPNREQSRRVARGWTSRSSSSGPRSWCCSVRPPPRPSSAARSA